MQNPVHEVFNDGFLEYGHDVTKRINGKRVGSEFEPKGKLAYQELSARDQDYQMAGYMNASLDLKVKTYLPPIFKKITKSKLKCVIAGQKFDVIKSDYDKQHLYLYLQEVGVSNE